jgi:hypothetical protein
MTLTTQELIILILAILLVFSVLGVVFKSFFRVILSIAVVVCLTAVCFFWLPDKVGKIMNGQTTANEVVNGVTNDFGNSGIPNAINTTIDKGKEYYNGNKESWGEAAKNLWEKLEGLVGYHVDVQKTSASASPTTASGN